MTTEYITLKVGDTFQVGDQIYVKSEDCYRTIDEQVAKFRFVVAPGSVCRRPVGGPVSKSDRREWEEEEEEAVEAKDVLTLQEERNRAEAYLQTVLKENMDLHNEVHRLQEHHDRLKKQLAALEEKTKAAEKLHGELMVQARAERLKLTNERHLLQQEVHNLQHSLAAERRRLESLDAGGVEQEETELERKAWEVFVKYRDFNVIEAFDAADGFIAERDRRRKESGK